MTAAEHTGIHLAPQRHPPLIVIACSAGGLAGLFEVLAGLDRDIPAAIAIVQHRGPQHPHLLVELLAARTSLEVRHACDGDRIEPGVVYVCPPGVHMVTEPVIRLHEGPKIRHVQPSADIMLRSVAATHGRRAIGVVLSGAGADGALGARILSESGGMVVVQDPKSCAYPQMPSAAIATDSVDLVLPLADIPDALRRLIAAESWCGSSRGLAPSVVSLTTTVMLVDDHRIMLDGLRTMLGHESDIEVIAEAEDGRSAVTLAVQLAPDVVVMDVGMPGMDGIAATREILSKRPCTAVVALSAYTDGKTAARIMAAGAIAYVSKTDAFAQLAVVIRSAAARQPSVSSRVTW